MLNDVKSAVSEPLKHLQVLRPSTRVAEVWLNRERVRNAFNDEVIAELTQTFAALNAEPELRVVMLGARGGAFCAGADLNWMRRMADYTEADNLRDAQALAQMLWTIDQCPVPVVGRIQGDCYAGGMGLAAVCDVLVAASGVQFCLSEAKLGLIPATISPYVVRGMGVSAARRYFVTAERFSAKAGQQMGWVQEVCEASELDAVVSKIVQSIASNAPQAVRLCKQLVRDVAGAEITAALRANTAQRIASVRTSAEGRAGIGAFLNKDAMPWC